MEPPIIEAKAKQKEDKKINIKSKIQVAKVLANLSTKHEDQNRMSNQSS